MSWIARIPAGSTKRQVEFALRVAKALNCEVPEESEFARKNYFYPDLNKGYQITQYDKPLAVWGYLDIEGEEGEKRSGSPGSTSKRIPAD